MELLHTASKDKWEKLGLSRKAGVLAPLFSVYSKDSLGIADFSDLKLVIDWASLSGNSIIQLLPMNELGPLFCPYDSVSSFALEPAYVSFRLPPFQDKKIAKTITESLGKVFPCGRGYVDYALKERKIRLLRDIYAKEGKNDGEKLEKFISENSYWIWDFAIFKALKGIYKEKAWWEWEDRFKNREFRSLEDFSSTNAREINFQIWLQWALSEQFKEIRKYAQVKGVFLKGDLPILVSRDSADVWSHPEFFKLDFAAGAPPDMYCALGQRWGMPTYNWEKIACDGYKYLKEKLKYAENFYDILRIDHVVGLFRIWSIPYNEPLENQGLNGSFDPADEGLWQGHGRNLLSVILDNANMFLCAEDLGVIPKSCTDTLAELGIPGNDVQRWVKDWRVRHDFLGPKDYRQLSVAMLSTHDTTNWAAWWENEASTVDEGLFMRKCSDHRQIDFGAIKNKLFDLKRSGHGRLRWLNKLDSVDKLINTLGRRREELGDFIDLYENSFREKEKLWEHFKIKGSMREKSDSEIVRAALKLTLDSSAIFCIQLITDWLYLADIFKGDSYQYRVNTPGTISDKNWSQVLPLSLEKLLKHKVTKQIRKMIADSGRI